MTDRDETADLVPPITEAFLEHATAEGQPASRPGLRELASAEVVYALVEAKAVGELTISGADPVIITGTTEDRERAQAVLKAKGLTLTTYPERDEWRRL